MRNVAMVNDSGLARVLDAFEDGGERRVDLAEVNWHVFVNNVSLAYMPMRSSGRGSAAR